jgi:hypothetical protein
VLLRGFFFLGVLAMSEVHKVSHLPARFILAGLLLNVYQSPKGKDREGREYGGDYKLQLTSADYLRNGESKMVQSEVSVGEDVKVADLYKAKVGKVIKLPVTVYAAQSQLRLSLAGDPAQAVASA